MWQSLRSPDAPAQPTAGNWLLMRVMFRCSCSTPRACDQRGNAMKPFALKLIAAGRTFGPYVAIELLLPGGSLIALLLWLYRTHAGPRPSPPRPPLPVGI